MNVHTKWIPFVKFGYVKQLILDQTEQNGHQTVPFCVYIDNLMFVFILIKCFEKSLGMVVILSLVWNGNLFLTFKPETSNT